MKNILSKYSYQIRIIIIYTILLMVVYGYMTSVLSHLWWTGIIVGSVILVAGIITAVIYIHKKEKTNNLKSDK